LRSIVPRNSGAQDIEFGVEQFVAVRQECAGHNALPSAAAALVPSNDRVPTHSRAAWKL